MSLWNPRTWHWRRLLRTSAILALVLVTLVFAVHLIWTMTASRGLARERAACIAAGMPMDVAAIIPPPVSDSNNAAIDYEKAYRLLTVGAQSWTSVDSSVTVSPEIQEVLTKANAIASSTQEWSEAEATTVLSILQQFAPVLAEVERGTRKPLCRFALHYTDGPNILLPHIQLNTHITKLLELRIRNARRQGDHATIVRDATILSRLAEHEKQDGFLISLLVGTKQKRQVLVELQRLLTEEHNPDLYSVEFRQSLRSKPASETLIQSADIERICLAGWCFDRLTGTGDPTELTGNMGLPYRPWVFWAMSRLGRPLLLDGERHYLAANRQIRAKLLANAPIDSAFIDDHYRKSRIVALLLPSWEGISKKVLVVERAEQLAHMALAIADYYQQQGRYPVDPVAEGLIPAEITCLVGTGGVALSAKDPAPTTKPEPLLRWVVGVDPDPSQANQISKADQRSTVR